MDENVYCYIGALNFSSGEIYDDIPVDEVATLGDIGEKGYTVVSILGNEGTIPHVHLKRTGKIDVCVCLHENKFYKHGKYQDTITKPKEKALFDDFMKKEHKNSGMTNWEFAVSKWKEAYPKCPLNSTFGKKKPDYRTMTDSIKEAKRI